jgi:hypothetical protein
MNAGKPHGALWPAAIIAWIGTYFAARYAIDAAAANPTLRVCFALAPLLPSAVIVGLLWRGLRSLDEMHRRIQLEALAFAFPLSIVLLWILGLLELAIKLDPDNWGYRHVWAMLPTFYLVGLALAWRRYS